MEGGSGKLVFVTVGTTSFDELIQAATDEKLLKVCFKSDLLSMPNKPLLASRGYTHITLQIGNGEYKPAAVGCVEGINVEFYSYKKSLSEDMRTASLVISHGGAGSIMESLALQKPLIVVINELLMDNHQTELARQLHKEGHLLYTSHSNLYTTVEEMDQSALRSYEPGDPKLFGQYLDSVMGYPQKSD